MSCLYRLARPCFVQVRTPARSQASSYHAVHRLVALPAGGRKSLAQVSSVTLLDIAAGFLIPPRHGEAAERSFSPDKGGALAVD